VHGAVTPTALLPHHNLKQLRSHRAKVKALLGFTVREWS
jgi:hypothetical protein